MEIFVDGMHLSLREKLMIVAGATAAASLLVGFIGAWIGSYWGARRAARKAMQQAMTRPAPAMQGVAELAQSVDAMALEVERIAEAQRFLVKLMSEREAAHVALPAPTVPRAAGTVTPH